MQCLLATAFERHIRRRRSAIGQRLPHHRKFERRTHSDRAAAAATLKLGLGRHGRTDGQNALPLDEIVQTKARRALDDIRALAAARSQAVRERLARYPRPAKRRIHILGVSLHGRRVAPYVYIVIAAKTVRAEVDFCRPLASLRYLARRGMEWAQTLVHPARARRPIVHLEIDVGRQVAAPRRTDAVVPLSLQVERLTVPAARKHQVFGVFVEKLHRLRVRVARPRLRVYLVRAVRDLGDVQPLAVHHRGKFRIVLRPDLAYVKRFLQCLDGSFGDLFAA